MNENSPTWARASPQSDRRPHRAAEQEHDRTGHDRGADQDYRESGRDQARRLEQEGRVEQHPDRDEEHDGEGVPHRQRVGRRPEAEVAPADDHPGQKRPQRHRHPKEFGRPDRDAERHNQHCEGEQLPRMSGGDVVEQPRDDPSADHQHDHGEGGDLQRGQADQPRQPPGVCPASPEERGQQDEDEHGEQVLDDEPPDRRVAEPGVQFVAIPEHPGQHDGARD